MQCRPTRPRGSSSSIEKAVATAIRGDKITGKSDFYSRPELTKCLQEMKSVHLLLFSELSRLHRIFLGMANEVRHLIERGIHIKTLDGRLDTTAMPREITMLLVSILGYADAASQEHAQIISRRAEGRQVAMTRGVKFNAKRKYTKEKAAFVYEMRRDGRSWGNIAKSINLTVAMYKRTVDLEEVA